jgi:hypothetical protein
MCRWFILLALLLGGTTAVVLPQPQADAAPHQSFREVIDKHGLHKAGAVEVKGHKVTPTHIRHAIRSHKDLDSHKHLPLGLIETSGTKLLPKGKHTAKLVKRGDGQWEAHVLREGGKNVRVFKDVKVRFFAHDGKLPKSSIKSGSIVLLAYLPVIGPPIDNVTFDILTGGLVAPGQIAVLLGWLEVYLYIP